MFAPRGPLPARRMAAHRVVIAAAALTALAATAVGTALAVSAGQALPQTAPFAAAVAALPAFANALAVFRRTDTAAGLRAAEAA